MRTVADTAACPAFEARRGAKGFLARTKLAFAAVMPARRGLLDPRTLSDHLKRDIGALDGNDPRGPRR